MLALDPIFYVLIVLSIAAVTVSLMHLWQWFCLRHVFSANDKRGMRTQLIADYQACMQQQGISGQVLENETWRLAKLAIQSLSKRLKVLEVVATIAPLVGLLGTVLGMVEAFKAMELAGAHVNPAVLSGGIWKALATTAAGLVVAIPTFIAHSWFESKTQHAANTIQNDLEQFLTEVSIATPAE